MTTKLNSSCHHPLRIAKLVCTNCGEGQFEIARLREALEDAVKPHDAYCECIGCRIVYDKESPTPSQSEDKK